MKKELLKNTSVTQKQNSEEKVQEIKNDKSEYNVIIYSERETDKQNMLNILSKCEIFNKHSVVSFKERDPDEWWGSYTEFSTDLSINPDSVFNMLYKITNDNPYIALICIKPTDGTKMFGISYVTMANFKFFNKIKIKNSFTLQIILGPTIAAFKEMMISDKNICIWMNKNEIIPIVMIEEHPFESSIYPVYFDNTEILYKILYSYPYKEIKEYSLKDDLTSYYKKRKEYIKYIIKNNVRKFGIYYYDNKKYIAIQTTEPINIDNEYLWFEFHFSEEEKDLNSYDEYEYFKRIINYAEPYKRIINQGNEEGIQFAHINENVMSTDSDNKK